MTRTKEQKLDPNRQWESDFEERVTRTSDELLPCPFCGKRPKVSGANGVWYRYWTVNCQNKRCPAIIQIGHEQRKVAIQRWNKRT